MLTETTGYGGRSCFSHSLTSKFCNLLDVEVICPTATFTTAESGADILGQTAAQCLAPCSLIHSTAVAGSIPKDNNPGVVKSFVVFSRKTVSTFAVYFTGQLERCWHSTRQPATQKKKISKRLYSKPPPNSYWVLMQGVEQKKESLQGALKRIAGSPAFHFRPNPKWRQVHYEQ